MAGTEVLSAMLRNALKLTSIYEIVDVMEFATDSTYSDMLAGVSAPTTKAQLTNLGGYVVDGLHITVWAFLNYDNMAEAYSAIIGLDGDTDTNAAIYGS